MTLAAGAQAMPLDLVRRQRERRVPLALRDTSRDWADDRYLGSLRGLEAAPPFAAPVGERAWASVSPKPLGSLVDVQARPRPNARPALMRPSAPSPAPPAPRPPARGA